MFIRNAWYVGAWASDIKDQPFARTILGEPVVFFRGEDGKVAALEDRCCHRGLPLKFGAIEGNNIVCGYHGATFNCAGKCVAIPGQARIPSAMAVRSYPVVEQDELIWIWTGDVAQADPAQIVSFPFHQEWPHLTHTQHVKCDWKLMIGNLMDLTHLAYIHKSTIGGDPDAHTTAKFEVSPSENGVSFIRWLLNTQPPQMYVDAVGFEGRIDRWMEFEFTAPGSVKQFTGALNVGEEAYEKGPRQGGFALRVFHNVTPETKTSCFYFWSGCHGYRMDEPEVTKTLFAGLRKTFEEDEDILEAQQASLLRKPLPMISTVHDAAVVHAERVMSRRVKQEAEAVSNVVRGA
ncbi:aromatic ring-hydroxylating dioxygenase subunit alpha [Duganella phyllosphaerae]|uniref:Toluene-4-sulfonate monooxygenase system iron-sulfur subunit TsaM1 n=1 Tax=Duganella phyllosphaerae TaxID=762836 RepID=A0A1E7WUS7_9BURK|nr:aromatic ring-hydroxylating dioxygenase subunit alpha [Duganella phyllosphaerae]OFA03494.1 toluene-4-sulfonate monooxygenase system iron-sulfur subunit TsaM1 [Duganella phyllosphaerae]